jgi:large subunit ribosomal protein L25
MAETLEVQVRDTLGTRNTRRLRRAGSIPAVLYGHGQPNVCLTVSAEQLEAAVRHGSRLVMLTGAVSERAFVRDLQWDTFGLHPLHVDLTRVSEHEKVKVTVAVELRGEAPGVRAGGVINHLIHELDIECEVTAIPEKLFVSINQLKLGDSITIANMGIPAGVVVQGDVEEIVVECVEPAAEVEETTAEAAAGEPEVIGRKKEEEGEESEE